MGQARLVERAVGVGQIYAGVQQSGGEEAGGFGVAAVGEGLIGGFVPDIAPGGAVGAGEGGALKAVVGQDAEGRDDVLAEVFVLVIAEYNQEIGVEVEDFLADLAEAVDQPGAMLGGGGEALVVAVFLLHGFGPVEGVFEGFGEPFIAGQGYVDGEAAVGVGGDQRGVVGAAYAYDFGHNVASGGRIGGR